MISVFQAKYLATSIGKLTCADWILEASDCVIGVNLAPPELDPFADPDVFDLEHEEGMV